MGSDFHFGIRSISQGEMAYAFRETIFPLLPTTDILFLNGDFFETLVVFDSETFIWVYDMIMDLLRLCEEYKVKMRILRGTWTHDRDQCSRFEHFHRNGGFTFDLKYISNIEIEEIAFENRSLKIGYIPDDLPYKTSDDIVDVLRGKMTEMGWDYLDYGCVHGFFEFTFPKNVKQGSAIVFREDQFPFVRKIVDVGHVHQYRAKGKIISNGSFDRLCFGDEDSKGCIKITDKGDTCTIQFVENKHSCVFDTLVFSDKDTTESIRSKIDSHIKKLKTVRTIHLRFMVESAEHKEAIRSIMREVHPEVLFNINKSSEKDSMPTISTSAIILKRTEAVVAPTVKTLPIYIKNHLPSDVSMTLETIERHLQS